jgi:hypothetical protein
MIEVVKSYLGFEVRVVGVTVFVASSIEAANACAVWMSKSPRIFA